MGHRKPNGWLPRADEASIENLIDRHGLVGLLESIANICHEKSDHIASNWQDEDLAYQWNRAAARVGACADTTSVKAVSR